MVRSLAIAMLLVTLAACIHREGSVKPPSRIPERALQVLRNAATFELFSLIPEPVEGNPPGVGLLQRWPILGKTLITKAPLRDRILAAIESGTTEPGLVPADASNRITDFERFTKVRRSNSLSAFSVRKRESISTANQPTGS